MKKILLYIVLLFVFKSEVLPQAISGVFDHITIEDGLSHSLIHDITQDSTGFIWAATQEGLNRYDGYNITTFKINDHSETTILDNWITSIVTDPEGNIWFGTRAKGFGKFITDSSKFVNYYEILNEKFTGAPSRVQRVYITRDSVLWVGTWGGGLLRLDPATGKMKQYLHDDNNPWSISENRVYSIYEDSDGDLWVSSYKTGINKFSRKDEKFVNYQVMPNFTNGLQHNFIISITEDHTGMLWFASFGGGLYKFDKKKEFFTKIKPESGLKDSLITVVYEDSRNKLWVCADGGGIYSLQRETGKFINYRNEPANSRSLNNDRVWSLIEDREGALWFGTFSGGLNIYHTRKNSFNHIYRRDGFHNSLEDNFVKAIYADDKEVWIGTNSGIDIFDKNMNKIGVMTTKEGLTSDRIRFIGNFGDDKMWISTWGGGVNIYNRKNGKFSRIVAHPDDPNSLSYNFCLKILKYVDGNYYIATETGLNKYNPETGEIIIFDTSDDSTTVSSSQITDLFVDSYGNFWVGTQFGLNLFYPESGTFKRIISDGTNKTLNNYRVGHFLQDKKGRLWIGTYGGGLNLYDYSTETFTYITEEDGLSNNSIYDILEDDFGYLWISTNKGLNSYNPETGKNRIFTREDGVQNNEFNGGASAEDEDGTLYFGGINGVNYFRPENITTNQKPPKMVLTELKVNGIKRNFYGNPASPRQVTLDYTENFLNFTFSALEYSSPHLTRYKHRLVGLENYWSEEGKQRTITYTNLAPGDYTLRVIAANGDNFWNEEGITFQVSITPPWWGTAIAKVTFIFGLVILIIAVYRYRIGKVESNQKKLEKLVNERTNDLLESKKLLEEAVSAKDKLFSIIAHDLKNPFLPLLGYSELLANQYDMLSKEDVVNSAEQIHKSARSLYTLLENMLDWARIQLDKIEFKPEKLDLKQLVNEVLNIYRVTAENKKIMLENNILEGTIITADEDMLKAIFRNLVNNAIKFCREGDKIFIKSSSTKGMFEIRIIDTGVGIDSRALERLNGEFNSFTGQKGTQNEAGTGLGLFITKEMIAKHKGRMKILSRQGAGTEVRIHLPE